MCNLQFTRNRFTFAIAKYPLRCWLFCFRLNTNISNWWFLVQPPENVSTDCRSNSVLSVCWCFSMISNILAVLRLSIGCSSISIWWAGIFGASLAAVGSNRSHSSPVRVNYWNASKCATETFGCYCGSTGMSRFHWVYWFYANVPNSLPNIRRLNPIDRSQAFFVRANRYRCCLMCTLPFWLCLRMCYMCVLRRLRWTHRQSLFISSRLGFCVVYALVCVCRLLSSIRQRDHLTTANKHNIKKNNQTKPALETNVSC